MKIKSLVFCGAGPAREQGLGAEAEIYAIYLFKSYQGSGLGKMMMNQMFAFLRDSGFINAYVWVLQSNPSCKFYEACKGKLSKFKKSIRLSGRDYPELCYVFNHLDPLNVSKNVGNFEMILE